MTDQTYPEIRGVVERALEEDIGSGDITSQLTVPETLQAHGAFIAKQACILAGVEVLPIAYEIAGGASLDVFFNSGEALAVGDEIARVAGSARVLLACERTCLNFLQRLSGIATLARQYSEAVKGTKTKILDTRKTTPGLRRLEKMAAAAGGVTNHRLGLFDAVLIKNNHITAAGGVVAALEGTARFAGPVEIEVRTENELEEALQAGARVLLLDNLSPEDAHKWIRKIDGRAVTELSGGITLNTVRAYAEAEPDYISCGALTHSATAVDISFRLELNSSHAV